MTIQTAEWIVYRGLQHLFRPAEHGERVSWCGLVAVDEDLVPVSEPDPNDRPVDKPPAVQPCTPCLLAHGGELAEHHGANMYRAKDPDGVSASGND